jgi:hypothetical protein
MLTDFGSPASPATDVYTATATFMSAGPMSVTGFAVPQTR